MVTNPSDILKEVRLARGERAGTSGASKSSYQKSSAKVAVKSAVKHEDHDDDEWVEAELPAVVKAEFEREKARQQGSSLSMLTDLLQEY